MIEESAPASLRVHVTPRRDIRRRIPRLEAPKLTRDVNAIESLRIARKVSIANLCRVSGVSRRQYQRLRKGIGSPLVSTIERLASALTLIAQRMASTGDRAFIIDQGANYATIIDALRKRREELNLAAADVDDLAGFPEGYCNKLENWNKEGYGRGFGEESLRAWCNSLGVEIAMVRVDLPMSTERFINRIPLEQLRRRARLR